jgi:glycosyltransferase involved in cell wall biosynthesis
VAFALRVLLCIHHALDPDQGAPGVTLALGTALERAGCEVDYLAFDQVFGVLERERVGHQLRFPWRVAAALARDSRRFDVIDAATGDAWVWATLRRPGASKRAALVTRAHGLEHVADESTRRAARDVGPPLSRKYPLYHGGMRLWEVRRSLVLSDHCILLNPRDEEYARAMLRLPAERISVIPNGIAPHFHAAAVPEQAEGPLRLAFIGRWTTYKGNRTLVEVAELLDRRGVEFSMSLLGTGADAGVVLEDFPEKVRTRVSVVPSFPNSRLPELLGGHELFTFPSLSEGSSGSLLEAMACGLAPVATAVGAASEIIDGSNGVLVEIDDAEAIADAVERFGRDRDGLRETRRHAQQTARSFRWEDVAERTLQAYERALAARSTVRQA